MNCNYGTLACTDFSFSSTPERKRAATSMCPFASATSKGVLPLLAFTEVAPQLTRSVATGR